MIARLGLSQLALSGVVITCGCAQRRSFGVSRPLETTSRRGPNDRGAVLRLPGSVCIYAVGVLVHSRVHRVAAAHARGC